MTRTLLGRIGDGTLDRQRVAIAAALGSKAAAATGIEPKALDSHYRTRIEQIAAALSLQQCLAFGLECALRALPVWEARFPEDLRPRRALEAAQSWLSTQDAEHDFKALGNAAAQCYIDADYPELTEDVDPELCAAMEASIACNHAALAVESILNDEPHDEVCEVIGWIARSGVKAAKDRQSEMEWQTARLVALLLQ